MDPTQTPQISPITQSLSASLTDNLRVLQSLSRNSQQPAMQNQVQQLEAQLSSLSSTITNVPHSNRSSLAPDPLDLSPLSQVPSSPEMHPLPMAHSNDASGSTPQNMTTPQPPESPMQPQPQSLEGATDLVIPSPRDEAKIDFNLILAVALKVAQSQDVLLQHIQAARAPLQAQPQVNLPPQPAGVQPLPQNVPPPHLLPTLPAFQPAPPQHVFPAFSAPPGHPPPLVMPEPQLTAITAAPSFHHNGFILPATTAGHGVYSIQSLFPDIEESLLLAIGRHTLHPSQLSKLDTRLRDDQIASNLGYEDGVSVHEKKNPFLKDFPTFESLHYPLQRYFSVLQALMISSTPPLVVLPFIIGCNDYISLLNVLHLNYEWTAVLNFHFAVHDLCLSEMAQGNYSKWGRIDMEFQNRYLAGHARARTKDRNSRRGSGDNIKNQICNNFNFRTCYREKCQRIHKCRSCDGTDHGVSNCPHRT